MLKPLWQRQEFEKRMLRIARADKARAKVPAPVMSAPASGISATLAIAGVEATSALGTVTAQSKKSLGRKSDPSRQELIKKNQQVHQQNPALGGKQFWHQVVRIPAGSLQGDHPRTAQLPFRLNV